MHMLVIGGTGFIGQFVVPLLHDAGHTVTVFHRGTSAASLPPGVRSLRGDRHRLVAHRHELRALAPEVVIDMIASSGAQARTMMDTFRGAARRVVVLSSMDVYRACAVLHELEPGPIEPVPLTEDSPLRTIAKTYPAELILLLSSTDNALPTDLC